jgi:hypothetical protein
VEIGRSSGLSGAFTIPSWIYYPVTSIGDGAFANNRLTQVTVPNGVISIGAEAFANNPLTQVTIPGSVTYIGKDAFDGNPNISISLTIPDGVTSIKEAYGAATYISGNRGLVLLPDSNAQFDTAIHDGVYLIRTDDRDRTTSVFFRNLTSVTIPNSVTTIWFGSSYNQIITIPANVTVQKGTFGNFGRFYNRNGKKAGTYVLNGRNWGMQ